MKGLSEEGFSQIYYHPDGMRAIEINDQDREFGGNMTGMDSKRFRHDWSSADEWIEHVFYEIKSSGLERKLIAGIVITGGGSQLKHVTQLVEYVTGMDTRIGDPNEHLAKGADDIKSPMYATAVGLVIRGLNEYDLRKKTNRNITTQTPVAHKGGFFSSLIRTTKEIFSDDSADKNL